MGRLLAIPDIHGRLDLLNQLLEKLKPDFTQDKLIFLGDMIDRGPDSAGVIKRVRELVNAHPDNVVALAGNHEWLAINACVTQGYVDFELWGLNGGRATLRSYPGNKMPVSEIEWLAGLPLSHEEPGFFFSHAPLPRRRKPQDRDGPYTREELTWTYYPNEHEESADRRESHGQIGVCGHVHKLRKGIMAPRFYDHYIFADAGCGCSSTAPLVGIEVRTREVTYAWPVEAQITRSAEL